MAEITTKPAEQRFSRPLLAFVPVAVILFCGWMYRWVAEDAYIDFRIVHNILAGYGPVFNPGERLEAYTDPLWVAILAFFSGLFRFISIEWWSVILGLSLTGMGFWLGGIATINLAQRRTDTHVFPLGLLCVSAVPGVWMFATSGLETGLIFGWIGLTWWLLVRALRQKGRGLYLAAIVASLGFTIRPDMALLTLTFGVALFAVQSKNLKRVRHVARSRVLLASLLVLIPLASEIFRVAYFGLLVSNTAVAKSASRLWLSQGIIYFTNFVQTYWLWIPFVVLVAITAHRVQAWRGAKVRLDVIVLLAPVVGGLLDAAYVTAIGGDFMHARMLLPSFFSIFMIFWIEGLPSLKSLLTLTAVLVWAFVCVVMFRFSPPDLGIAPPGIANERLYYQVASGVQHPITPLDYANDLWEIDGYQTAVTAASITDGQRLMNWDRSEYFGPGNPDPTNYPAHTSLPETYYVAYPNIGLFGLAAGGDVYVADQLSLADPIGSHFIVTERGRPGHEKVIDPVWIDARFGPNNSTVLPPGTTMAQLVSARQALSCQPLAGYLKSITSKLTFGQVLDNFEHAFTWTTMSYDSDPQIAEQELCGP
jgi:arabinofuranosyltransferase